jgi:hypothetical protein
MCKQNEEEGEKITPSKAKRACDWALSCLIRLPIIILVLGVILAGVFLVMLLISPETVKLAIDYLKVWFGQN